MNSNNSTNGIKILFEFLGTFILSSAINLSTTYIGDTQFANPTLIFLSFFAAVTILRGVSGGHVNPAVSVGVYLEKTSDQRAKEQPLLTLYILSQTLGAVTACLFSYIFYRENVFKLSLAPGTIPLHAFIIEVIATALFIYTILCQGDSNARLTSDPTVSTIVVTLALFVSCNLAGNISGGCINPAIGFAHNFVRLLVTGDVSECKYMWLYVLGPTCGGILGSYLYKSFYRSYFYQNKEGINQAI